MDQRLEIPEDFPRTTLEFEERFASEEACAGFLAKLRWPNGFVCPRCSGLGGWSLQARDLVECPVCHYQASVTAGTVFHGTRKPLRLWFRAMFLMATQKLGLSAKNFQALMGLRSYQTAWTMLHKLRRATVNPGRDMLCGKVEVDDAYVGGKEEDVVGRQVETKTPVVVAVEVLGKASGRLRLRALQDVSAKSLLPFVRETVEPGSTVHTDGWSGYEGLAKAGYKHRVRKASTAKDPSKVLQLAHRAISNLKTWLLGTHHGVSPKHLQPYMDEFVFRFNRRRTPMAAFQTLLGIGSRVPTVTYKMLCASELHG